MSMELCATPCQQESKTSWLGSLAGPARLTQAPHYRRSAQPVSVSFKHRSNRGFQHNPALPYHQKRTRKEWEKSGKKHTEHLDRRDEQDGRNGPKAEQKLVPSTLLLKTGPAWFKRSV
ncbi:uncharacterized protein TrAtP1_003564 [Trichoderma atroviride]|uniref:Uncharacterized protein n=1 Tax=Hypocrea atroviridis (strain ATCC 20476 / IMI 206040) TaxID=452589 RepID=G9NWD6_HYPAI|nr:uncharacterized protein TRIATDRAFT_308831 [Trichoderma atroviride IMI 206040]EHK45296.1 hypothetical protein TRIATDRAFT_308831 [Trichoderma atroviride IMI 206040]UKZ62313.1 hypothetical protein TrAtP1_003564 [Trichoderma atroviride]